MSVDTLSDVLRAVRLKGAVFFDVHASAPWVAEAPAAKTIAPAIMPGVEHVIEYHVVVAGSCWAELLGKDHPPVRMNAGDVIAFPQGDPHVLASAPGMRARPDLAAYRMPERPTSLPLVFSLDGGSAERADVICGFLGCDARPFNPLLDALPPVIHMPHAPAERRDWLARMMQYASLEGSERSAGAATMLARAGELMFVDLVRRYLEGMPAESQGWLAGLRDPQIGRALNLLHERARDDWSIDSLAREIGVSRSTLSERFTKLVGCPPMRYLARWRLQLAAGQLAEGHTNIATIADSIGYESEAAFSRAFKRETGMPPAEWRERRRA